MRMRVDRGRGWGGVGWEGESTGGRSHGRAPLVYRAAWAAGAHRTPRRPLQAIAGRPGGRREVLHRRPRGSLSLGGDEASAGPRRPAAAVSLALASPPSLTLTSNLMYTFSDLGAVRCLVLLRPPASRSIPCLWKVEWRKWREKEVRESRRRVSSSVD